MKKEHAPEAICVWDTETGGVDITTDRIYTAYARIRTIDGETLKEQSWVIDPGEPINPAAAEVNGLTDEFIKANGVRSQNGIAEIYDFLSRAKNQGYPIVGYNNSFDLGILDYEMRRHFNVELASVMTGAQFFDPIVYDRAMDKWRKGKRTLEHVAPVYGVPFDPELAHDAKYDVEVTCKLAWRMFQKSPYTLAELQDLQVGWKRKWAKDITKYFAREGKTEEDGSPIIVSGAFPW